MAQKWYEKASVQATIPASVIAIGAIVVQIWLAKWQINLSIETAKKQAEKDSVNSVESSIKYHNDSSLAANQLALNKLQLKIASQKRTDDIELNSRQERISRNELIISERQFSIQKRQITLKKYNDLIELGKSINRLIILGYSNHFADHRKNFDGTNTWVQDVINVMEKELTNPVLIENKEAYSKWSDALSKLKYQQWMFSVFLKEIHPSQIQERLAEDNYKIERDLEQVSLNYGSWLSFMSVYYQVKLESDLPSLQRQLIED
ncbi:hypothetical protein GCM10028819_32480 [Spirosoma humi]